MPKYTLQIRATILDESTHQNLTLETTVNLRPGMTTAELLTTLGKVFSFAEDLKSSQQ
jgi:hypothetical protein